MITGGLAFIDCLGFKGIWRKHSPEVVLDQLERASKDAAHYLELHAPFGLNATCTFLSDTVVIGVSPKEAVAMTDVAQGFCVVAAATIGMRVAQSLLRGNPPITVRGCVNFGKYLLRPNHIIGPAVDEAASWHERAQGAFIWIRPDQIAVMKAYHAAMMCRIDALTPDQVLKNVAEMMKPAFPGFPAQLAAALADPLQRVQGLAAGEKVKQLFREAGLHAEFPIYNVPMKGGDFLQCPVVNLIAFAPDIDDLLRRYEVAMTSDELDVMIKRQNTMRFLRSVERDTRAMTAAFSGAASSTQAPGSAG